MREIVRHLGDTSRPLKRRELRQLNDIGEQARPEFAAAWREVALSRRREIATALVELAEDNVEFDFRDVFRVLIDDGDADVRLAAVEGLWEDERLSTLRALLPLLDGDAADEVRAAVALALGRFAYRASLDELPVQVGAELRAALLAAATNVDLAEEVRRRALESLGYFSDEEVTQVIARAYASGQRRLKESALAAMGHSMDPRWLPIVAAELQSSEPALQYEAARASGELGEAAAGLVALLTPLANGEDVEVAQAAIWALGQIGGAQAERALKRLLRSDRPVIQQAAEEALAELSLDDLQFGF
ncbi:HEAT repeat domain-containing protein [Kallotenue papyrolyticum]|uniref:HEAT repeat domain-containing protein n=1 Tax=Kallotenue papyrolyticum TaxID=1325125 RepID=UPI00047867E9|nr:HEAT repeat domain-containing protein [Kallotenue papyrolyticum]